MELHARTQPHVGPTAGLDVLQGILSPPARNRTLDLRARSLVTIPTELW